MASILRAGLIGFLALAPAISATSQSSKEQPTNILPRQAEGSCKDIDDGSGTYTDDRGQEYTVECNTDRGGDDLRYETVNNFVGCFSVCDDIDDCIGFSYLPGTCYLKSGLNPLTEATTNTYVHTAFKNDMTEDEFDPDCPTASTVTVTATPTAS